MVRVAIIGTVGVPANYGGFETLVENIIDRRVSHKIKYQIYCSGKSYENKLRTYKGADLHYVSLKANGVQSVFYDIVSLVRASFCADIILVLGVSGCSFLPFYRLFFKKKLVINVDGLEHRRDKWGKMTKRFLKFSERMAIKYGDVIIADNRGIQDYVEQEYGAKAEVIAYGGDHVLCTPSKIMEMEVLNEYSLKRNNYSFAVCRIEPENNIHMILAAFAQSEKEILFVGNWERSEYGLKLLSEYKQYTNIKMLSPIYDITTLYVLRSNCLFYIHGHSAGGTNPSLVEAMFFDKPIFAFNVIYNRETTENKANYFSTEDELKQLICSSDIDYNSNAHSMYEIANRRYRWEKIAKQYEILY